jgi:glycosyltransferase involved in cell wall biosynthesis
MSSRYRVAIVAACPFPAARGTPVRIFRIAERLAQRGHEVDVFTYHLGAATDHLPFRTHRIANIPSYRKQSPGPSYQKLFVLDPLLAAKLSSALRRERYDVIHAHHAEGLLAAVLARRQLDVPIVYDIHTLLGSELPYYRMGLSRSLLESCGGYLDRRLPRRADHVIAVSEEIRANVMAGAGIAADCVSLIPNGVEEIFCAAGSRDTSGCTHSGPVVVYAGTLASYQGFDRLLEAFAIARAGCPSLWLHVYTQSPFDPFEVLAARLGIRDRICVRNVELAELPGNLAAADVAVNPRMECSGMPQKLGNYMATGCPIVTFAGSAKHVTHGTTGLVVPNGDVNAFAFAILQVVGDRTRARELGDAAREFARAELSWQRVAERIEAVYERVVRSPAAA